MNKKHIIGLLVIGLLIIAGVVAYARGGTSNGANQDETTTSVTMPAETTASDEGAGSSAPSCGLTPATTEGPYYLSNTKQVAEGNLNYDNLPGDKMKISGYVYGSADNTKPLSTAKVEIWHADSSGKYHPQSNGDAAKYSDDELSLRGYVVTDSNGYYEFTSIFPAEYEGRTRHIHVRASGDGYKPVVTQMITYREGDKIKPSSDNVARNLPNCNLLTFTDVDGTITSNFDFHLAAE